MSDATTEDLAGETPVARPEELMPPPLPDPLDPAIAALRQWFAALPEEEQTLEDEPEPGLDMATILGHYLSLRQEVNLQTRAVRNQQEQTGEVVRQLQQSFEQLSRTQTRNEQMERQAQLENLRPLLTALIELHDSLSLAGREIVRVQAGLAMEDGDDDDCEPMPSPPQPPRRSFFSRWILSPSADEMLKASQEETYKMVEKLNAERAARMERAQRLRENLNRVRQSVAALVTGYNMSLDRVERALRKEKLEAMVTVGEVFDPETMEAVEAVPNSGRPSGEVLEEIRRGYLYNGRVFRYAQVRVARG